MRGAIVFLALVACRDPAAITADRGEDAGAPAVAEPVHDPPHAPPVAPDASAPDAEADACAPGEVWEASVRARKTWHAMVGDMLPGPLELVVPRLGVRKTIYPDCGITGGGCGDCARRAEPGMIACELTPARVHVDVGLDDVGPTYVEVAQRGDAIVAYWTHGGLFRGPGSLDAPTHETKTLVKLPCSVKIRFVR